MSLGGGVKGAATGAGIGSLIMPGIGTGIGAGIGGLIGLFKGGDDKEDKPKFDSDQTAIDTIGRLNKQADLVNQKGAQFDAMSTEALAPVLNYFKAIASGDPGALMQATMPERGRVIDQYDAARKSASISMPRSGGATSALLNSYVSEANQLSDITAGARKEGMTALGNLGVTTAGLSLSADQLASADMDSIIRAVFGERQLENERRGQNMALWGDVGTAAGSIIGAILTKGG